MQLLEIHRIFSNAVIFVHLHSHYLFYIHKHPPIQKIIVDNSMFRFDNGCSNKYENSKQICANEKRFPLT